MKLPLQLPLKSCIVEKLPENLHTWRKSNSRDPLEVSWWSCKWWIPSMGSSKGLPPEKPRDLLTILSEAREELLGPSRGMLNISHLTRPIQKSKGERIYPLSSVYWCCKASCFQAMGSGTGDTQWKSHICFHSKHIEVWMTIHVLEILFLLPKPCCGQVLHMCTPNSPHRVCVQKKRWRGYLERVFNAQLPYCNHHLRQNRHSSKKGTNVTRSSVAGNQYDFSCH